MVSMPVTVINAEELVIACVMELQAGNTVL